jgi:hypothetical protein
VTEGINDTQHSNVHPMAGHESLTFGWQGEWSTTLLLQLPVVKHFSHSGTVHSLLKNNTFLNFFSKQNFIIF